MSVVSQEQNRANLRSAEKLVSYEMGLDESRALNYDQRAEFNRRLSAKILQYPDRFTPQTIETARLVAGRQYEPLADSSFSWEDFAKESFNNAVDAGADVAEIGKGTLRAVSMAGWLIPAAALFVVGVFAWSFAKKKGVVK